MKKLLFLAFSAALYSCNSGIDETSAMSETALAENIKTLASDDFMGRMPFTEGENKTLEFLEAQFKEIGTEPGNEGSYFQDIPLVNITTKATREMSVNSPSGSFTLKGFDDYVVWTDRTEEKQSLDKADLVFAGYGVVAPEYGWNDYEGLDVKGKVVLVLVNDPGYRATDSTLFKGKTMTYYGRWTYKFEEAARQGAKAVLVIHNTAAASYPFSVLQNGWNTSQLQMDTRGKEVANCDMVGWVTEPTAIRLFEAAGYNKDLLKTADSKDFKPIDLKTTISTSMTVETEYNNSKNVIAKISGSKHTDEYIIYTAHWDHLGVGTPNETGDSIYNGALDNASGTAGLLELAKAFKAMNPAPERTIVFLAVTAEEQGLLGSEYYAFNPIYPVEKTLANINMDVLNYYGKTKDMIIVGSGQNDLEDLLIEAMSSQNRVLKPEPRPEAGYYYRSDHFNFAKVGVPALYLERGEEVIGKEEGFGAAQNEEYTSKLYHRPSDQFNDRWRWDGAIADLELLFKVGKEISSSENWPVWKEGSEFKSIRESN